MKRSKKVQSALLITSVSLIMTGCSPEEAAPENGKVGLANPASQYCAELGGKLLPEKDVDGNEYALCQLPDGTVIEEWELFRREHPTQE